MADNHMSRHIRLVELEGLPSLVKRCIGLAWCYGMANDHENAAEQLLRALEVLLEDWDGEKATGPAGEGAGRPGGQRRDETDAGGTGAAAGSGAADAPDGERPAARVDSGEAA